MTRLTLIPAFAMLATQAAAHTNSTVHLHETSFLPVIMGLGLIAASIAAVTLIRVRARRPTK